MRRTISFALKAIIVIAAVVGVTLSALGGNEEFMGGGSEFMYFTIQSNIAIALTAIVGLILMILKKQHYAWEVIKLVFTVSITLTGLVFCGMLAPFMGLAAFRANNILTHMVVPLSAIADFFVEEKLKPLRKRDSWYVVLPPIAYVIYAGIGFALNWEFAKDQNYPYYFLNWGSEAGAFGFAKGEPYPTLGCVYYIIFLAAIVAGIGILYVVLGNKANKKKAN